MCHERERLIEYVYDECAEGERRAIEGHLEECTECRVEMSGFRRVRQDLLAWDVPEHDSVWRAFAAPRVAPFWREVPVWAMAAAAVAVFAIGAAGGVAARAFVPAPEAQIAERLPAGSGLDATDVTALETRILQTLRSEMDGRLQPVAARVAGSADQLSEAEARLMRQFRAELRAAGQQQLDRIDGLERFVDVVGSDLLKNTSRINEVSRAVTEFAGGPGR